MTNLTSTVSTGSRVQQFDSSELDSSTAPEECGADCRDLAPAARPCIACGR